MKSRTKLRVYYYYDHKNAVAAVR